MSGGPSGKGLAPWLSLVRMGSPATETQGPERFWGGGQGGSAWGSGGGVVGDVEGTDLGRQSLFLAMLPGT